LKPSAEQLVWRGFDGTALPDWLADEIAKGRCGGIVLFARNIETPHQVSALCRQARAASGDRGPFAISVDQEGGRVARLREPHFRNFPPARQMDTADLQAIGRAMGEQMASVGINLDFAPVLDVQESLEGVIGARSFGGDPDLVARRALAWLEGLELAGVAGCVKHFPGHGDGSCDSHVDLPIADRRTRERHLPPFARAVEAGVRAVMVGHLMVESLDPDLPATLSNRIVSGVLRQQMGFDGVVFTDDMQMGAITRGWGIGEAAVMAVRAGCDALLVCSDRQMQDQAADALRQEASSSAAFATMIEGCVQRSRRLSLSLSDPPAHQGVRT
jgi:beta-N-acetylhexosaminidase